MIFKKIFSITLRESLRLTEIFRPSQFWVFDVSRSFISISSEFFSIGFNARVIAHLKYSSSSFLRLIIAFFLLLENLEAEFKRKLEAAYILRCGDSDKKLNEISNYFPVFEILLKTPKQFLSFLKTIR